MKRAKTAAVCAATGMPEPMLRRYLDRKLIPIDATDVAKLGSGTPRQFGVKSVVRIAMIHKCVCAGIKPAVALKLAALFCDERQPGREPGELFKLGRTLIVATADDAGRIINLTPDRLIDEMLASETAIVIDLGRIVRGVHLRLGLTSPTDVASILKDITENRKDAQVERATNV